MSENDVRGRISALSQDQRAALAHRLRGKEAYRPIPKRPTDAREIPLSYAQERLWFVDQLYPGLPAYHLMTQFRVSGAVDDRILKRAVDALIARHEVLRTTFKAANGRPVQVIADSLSVPVERLSFQPVAGEDGLMAAQALIARRALDPFDVTTGPLLRVLLIDLAPTDTVVALAMHHIVADGLSLAIIQRELGALYNAFCCGLSLPLPTLPIQYADYAIWQRQFLRGSELARLQRYWHEKLRDAPRGLDMHYDRARPTAMSSWGAVQSFAVPERIAAGLRRVARGEGVTLFMLLLSAWKVLLCRFSGQTDLVVGIPVANRTRIELEPLIGFFTNILVLRTDLGGNPTFRDVLRRVRETVIGGFAHQEMPFERLVEDLQPERSLSRHPLVQVMFALEAESELATVGGAPVGGVGGDGAAETIETELVAGTAKFDLTLYTADQPDGMRAALEYSTDLFEHDTIRRMAHHLVTLLGGIIETPDCRVSELPLLPPVERRRLLSDWNGASAPLAAACFHHLIEAMVDAGPQEPAIICGSQVLCYDALDRRANQLAHHLIAVGVGPEMKVGLCVDRSPDMIIAMLAIWKAGGAYIPLDPGYPSERLRFMADDAALCCLVTTSGLEKLLPSYQGRRVVLDGADRDLIALRPVNRPTSTVGASHLAYIIYTSGSTGRPKGVLLHHRGLCNAAAAMAAHFSIHRGTRTLNLSSLSFDASLFEIAMTLSGGGALYVAPREELLPGLGLIERMREARITNAVIPSSLLAALPSADLPELHEIITGAEACPVEVLARWVPGRRFFNGYGPTEATIFCTLARIEDATRKPPIGKPIANMRIYLLDHYLNPIPIGIPGELYISGPGLAHGYLGAPGLTAERFLPDPFAHNAGERMYRTGDLARWLPDGNLEFVGRVDQQIKLRGFRIEPGEIEAALGRVSGVDAAVVVLERDQHGNASLVAYCASAGSTPVTVNDVRMALRQLLPDYMVPSRLVIVGEIPLSPNGKIDRAALDACGRKAINAEGSEAGMVLPRTPLEIAIAEVWSEVLGLETIGAFDNFFDVGGHSLLATQVISRLRTRLGIDVPIRNLFEGPTVAAMAAGILEAAGPVRSDGAVAVPNGGSGATAHEVVPRDGSITSKHGPAEGDALDVAAMSDDEVEVMLRTLHRDHEVTR
jgi:amino acid adenylation domain-containing protein